MHKGVFQDIIKHSLDSLTYTVQSVCKCQVLPELGLSIKFKNSPILLNQLKAYHHISGADTQYTSILVTRRSALIEISLIKCYSRSLFFTTSCCESKSANFLYCRNAVCSKFSWQELTEENVTSCRDSDAPEAGGAAELVQMRLNTTAVLQMPDLGLGF